MSVIEPPKTFMIRSEKFGEAELVIGNGDHTCLVFPLNFDQARNLSASAARIVAYWPAEPQVIAGD